MAETIKFEGRVRIERDDHPDTTKPFMVVIWDDESNEREERLEQSFEAFVEAQAYARGLIGQQDNFTPVPVDGSVSGEWIEGTVRGIA